MEAAGTHEEFLSEGSCSNPDDYGPSVYEQQEEYLELGKKVPRKLRTHNLKLTTNYCRHWPRSAGVREIIQNFLDGLCSAFNSSIQDIDFRYKQTGSPYHKSWKEEWIACLKKDSKTECGRISWDRKAQRMEVKNNNVRLRESVLNTGHSTKQSTDKYIGCHGEGMKIGILRLVWNRAGEVRYYTNGQSWHFFLKKERGAERKTLHYRTRKTMFHNHTLVKMTNISEIEFERWKYLALCRDEVEQVASYSDEGYLLKQKNKNTTDLRGCLFVKGLFVRHGETVIPINLLKGEIDRDRDFVSELENPIAKIWDSTMKEEGKCPVEDRLYTGKLLDLSRNTPNCLEHRCMEHMSSSSASLLLRYLKESQSPDIFPYDHKNEDDRQSICEVLRKKPFPCSKNLLKLLKKDESVITVEAAIEKAFIEAQPAPNWLKEARMAKLLKSFISAMSSNTEVVFKDRCALKMLLKNDHLYVNKDQALKETTMKEALEVLTTAEFALGISRNEEERKDLAFRVKEFIAGTEFQTNVIMTTSNGVEHEVKEIPRSTPQPIIATNQSNLPVPQSPPRSHSVHLATSSTPQRLQQDNTRSLNVEITDNRGDLEVDEEPIRKQPRLQVLQRQVSTKSKRFVVRAGGVSVYFLQPECEGEERIVRKRGVSAETIAKEIGVFAKEEEFQDDDQHDFTEPILFLRKLDGNRDVALYISEEKEANT